MIINDLLENTADEHFTAGDFHSARLEYLQLYREFSRKRFSGVKLLLPFSRERTIYLKICDRLSELYLEKHNFSRCLYFIDKISRYDDNLTLKTRKALCFLFTGRRQPPVLLLYQEIYPLLLERGEKVLTQIFNLLTELSVKSRFAYQVCSDYARFRPEIVGKHVQYLMDVVLSQTDVDGDHFLLEELYRLSRERRIGEILSKHYLSRKVFTRQAFALVNRLYEQNPGSDLLRYLGEYYRHHRTFSPESLQIFLKIYEERSDDRENLLVLGESFLKQGARDEFAIHVYEEVAKKFTSHLENLKTLALLYAENGKCDAQALAILEQVSYYMSDNRTIMKSLVHAYLVFRIFTPQALWCARKLLELSDDSPEVLYLAARSYLAQGKKKEALVCLEKAEKTLLRKHFFHDDFLVTLYRLKLHQLNREELAKHLEILEGIYRTEPKGPEILELMGDIRIRMSECWRKIGCSFQDCECSGSGCAFNLTPDDPARNALEYYLQALEFNQTGELLFKIGEAYLASGYRKMALDFFERAREIKPENGPVTCLIAALLEQSGKKEEAVEILSYFLSDNQNFHGIFQRLLALLWELSDWDGGINFSCQAIKRFPEKHEFYHWRGKFYRAKEWRKVGLIDLEQAFSMNQ
ncbi:MAG: hypothetical protein PHW04_17945, partial [Candidatus Wallbacteria bacterium]|nr:hypothetical protein [Candidatus Wallbacteria bacterium]